MSAWFDQAEDDLLYMLGTNEKKCSRGQIVSTISVNIINTFKTPVSSFSMSARVLRWVQCRFQDFAGALEAWGSALHFPSTISSLRRVKAIIRFSINRGIVISPFSKYRLVESRKTWHPKIKSVVLQMDALVRVSGFRRPDPTLLASLVARARMFAATATASALKQEEVDLSECNRSWREWVRMAGQGSAGAAHRFVKAPLALGQFDLQGSHLSRSDMLDAEVEQWSGLWQHGKGTPPIAFSEVPILPPLLPGQLADASRAFKTATCALGGVHPRHIALLDGSALAVLANLLEVAEAVGILPDQLADLLIVLLPKVTWGLRPIGWYQSVFRIWIKARLHIVKSWEATATADCGFGAERGKAPLDIVWRHSFRAESATVNGGHFVVVLWDLHKCYEQVDHALLIAAARRHGYPLAILRLCIYSYRAPRRIVYNNICSSYL